MSMFNTLPVSVVNTMPMAVDGGQWLPHINTIEKTITCPTFVSHHRFEMECPFEIDDPLFHQHVKHRIIIAYMIDVQNLDKSKLSGKFGYVKRNVMIEWDNEYESTIRIWEIVKSKTKPDHIEIEFTFATYKNAQPKPCPVRK